MSGNLLLAMLIVVSALFLICLGMRNPSLDHNRGPRQRPRAVVENIMKSPVAEYEVQLDCELHPPTAVLAASAEAPHVSSPSPCLTPAPVGNLLPSRASPSAISTS